jgi:hypothetical protein
MNKDEINRYCATGAGVCIYRKRVKKAQFIIQSIYISKGVTKSYRADVEFDSMRLVNQGEGIRWAAEVDKLEEIVQAIEAFSGIRIEDWENYTKSGFAPLYDSEIVTNEHYQNSRDVLEHKYENGALLPPSKLNFRLFTAKI